MPRDPGPMAKVKYVGNRTAAFEMTVNGITRRWAAKSSGKDVAAVRWLPRAEASIYNQMSDFEIVKQQSIVAPARPHRKKKTKSPKPKPPAVPVRVLLAAAAATAEAAQDEPEVKLSPFVMSRGGVVHRRGCVRCPKVPLVELETLAEAREHSRFKRFHRSCIEV